VTRLNDMYPDGFVIIAKQMTKIGTGPEGISITDK